MGISTTEVPVWHRGTALDQRKNPQVRHQVSSPDLYSALVATVGGHAFMAPGVQVRTHVQW